MLTCTRTVHADQGLGVPWSMQHACALPHSMLRLDSFSLGCWAQRCDSGFRIVPKVEMCGMSWRWRYGLCIHPVADSSCSTKSFGLLKEVRKSAAETLRTFYVPNEFSP